VEGYNAFLLWNDDPRLRNVLAPELLPEMTGLQELGEFLSDPIKHKHLKSEHEARGQFWFRPGPSCSDL
jgi:hypothetical protein